MFTGVTEYHAQYDHTVGYAAGAVIPQTTFTGNVDLEGHLYANGRVRPQVSMPISSKVGEWMDHAYIAQIAGVGYNPSVISRIFVVNRSCDVVIPTFKVFNGGQEAIVTNILNYKNAAQTAEIPVNAQHVYQLKDIIEAAVVSNSAMASSGVYAIEVILPGKAEDFYIYAQAKKADNTDTMDLPVYSTSRRD